MLALLPQSHVGDWAVPDTDRAKARIFISYKRAVEPDERVALEVYHALAAAHDVFIDRSIEIGDPWGKEIAQRIGDADFFIVFLSADSVASDMVRGEIEKAYQRAKAESSPKILPVRLDFEAPLEYPLNSYLSSRQTATWSGDSDTSSLIAELKAAINEEPPPQPNPASRCGVKVWLRLLRGDRKQLLQQIEQCFGLPGVIATALLSVAWFVWITFIPAPRIETVAVWWSCMNIPKAGEGKVAIAVAHLEGDPSGEKETILASELVKFEGVSVLRLCRKVAVQAIGDQTENLRKGHKKARDLLAKSNADIMIWGNVLKFDGQSALELRWTTEQTLENAKHAERYRPDINLSLPPAFWEDIMRVVRLLVWARGAGFSEDTGNPPVDQIKPFVIQTRQLLEGKGAQWKPEDRAGVEFALAYALDIWAEQTGDTEALIESIQRYRALLATWTQAAVPLDWAMIQDNFGTALLRLGERELGTGRLIEALAAYNEALEERTQDKVPEPWASTMNNVGIALMRLGEREENNEHLKNAIAALSEALKVRTRDKVPMQWATTQHNLGAALTLLGKRGSGMARLQEAVAAFREALKERTRDKLPLLWAMTESNLGAALALLGERDSGTARLEEAVVAFSDVLKVRTRDKVPMQWAITQHNLANALELLGNREAGSKTLGEAVTAYSAALEVFLAMKSDYHVKGTEHDLKRAKAALTQKSSQARAGKSERAFRFRVPSNVEALL